MGTGMETAFVPRAEHNNAIENLKERIRKEEKVGTDLISSLGTRVSMRLFLWIVGTLIGVLVVVFGVQYGKLNNVLEATHAIEKLQVGIGKDIESLTKAQNQDHSDTEAFKRTMVKELSEALGREHAKKELYKLYNLDHFPEVK